MLVRPVKLCLDEFIFLFTFSCVVSYNSGCGGGSQVELFQAISNLKFSSFWDLILLVPTCM
jgi:hypothetical protein